MKAHSAQKLLIKLSSSDPRCFQEKRSPAFAGAKANALEYWLKAMNKTILLLASDPIIRKAFSRALEAAGYCVLAVGDVGTAVDRIKDCPPDLLMVRHYTESMSGHEAAVYLRKKVPGIPVLMVGGLLDESGLENRSLIEGFEVFPKPFTVTELLDKVKRVVSKCSHHKGTHPSDREEF